ncbi:unnamed protein product, partial [Ectocarpus fasciculatus]
NETQRSRLKKSRRTATLGRRGIRTGRSRMSDQHKKRKYVPNSLSSSHELLAREYLPFPVVCFGGVGRVVLVFSLTTRFPVVKLYSCFCQCLFFTKQALLAAAEGQRFCRTPGVGVSGAVGTLQYGYNKQ